MVVLCGCSLNLVVYLNWQCEMFAHSMRSRYFYVLPVMGR